MANTDNTQQPDIINMLLSGGMPQQGQSQISNVLSGLLQYAKSNNPQSANAALGPSTTNVLNNASTALRDPNLAAGNYDATQNTGINQQQLAQTLQTLAQTNKSGMTAVDNQPNSQGVPLSPSQQMMYDSAKKNLGKHYDTQAQNVPPSTLETYINQFGGSQPGQIGQGQVGQNLGGQQPTPLNKAALPQPSVSKNSPAPNSTQQGNPTQNNGMTDDIQDQAQKIALQKPGLLMSIFKGTFENNNAKQLENLRNAQTITQGGPPLSPAEKTQAIGNWNSALLQQHKDFQSDLSGQMKSNVDAMESFVKNTPLPTKASDWSGYNQKLQQYHTNIRDIADKQLKGYNQFTSLQLTNPATKEKQALSSQYSNITPDMARQELANRIKTKRGNQ